MRTPGALNETDRELAGSDEDDRRH